MNRAICEREEQTTAAIRSGPVSQEIASHAQHCAACAEILLVGEFLRTNAALPVHEPVPSSSPTFIWQRAQRRATQQAVHRALRPIRFMTVIACIAFACSPWLRWLLPMGKELSTSWSKAFDLDLAFVSKAWPATATEATLFLGLSGTVILLALSSWYMLREE